MENRRPSTIAHAKNLRLIIVSLAAIFTIIAILFYESYSSYKSKLKGAEIQSNNLSQLLEERISSSFKRIDLELQLCQEEYKKEKSIDIKRSSYFNKLMLFHKKRLPEVSAFRAVDF